MYISIIIHDEKGEEELLTYQASACEEERIRRLCEAASGEENKKSGVRIEVIGAFNVYSNERPVHFSNKKAKELLAILVDARGGIVSMERIISILWRGRGCNKQTKQLYRKAVYCLRRVLEAAGETELLRSYRGCLSFDINRVSCDELDFLKVKTKENGKSGTYMPEYEWAFWREHLFCYTKSKKSL